LVELAHPYFFTPCYTALKLQKYGLKKEHIMAHKQKYTRAGIGHMFHHYERSKEIPDLDTSRSHLNYNLAADEQPLKQLDFLHERLSQVKVHNRKDVNVMVDWVVTVPKDCPQNDEKRFFEATYAFLNNRYGKENVISAYVHMDEVTPHIHYAFIPIVPDKKKGGYKLSAKETITRADLRSFHGDLYKSLQSALGYPVGVINGLTRDGNQSIQDLKRLSAQDRINEVNATTARIALEASEKLSATKDTIKALECKYEAFLAYFRECDKGTYSLSYIPEDAQVYQKGLLNKQEMITMPLDEWQQTQMPYDDKQAIQVAKRKLEQSLEELTDTFTYQRIQQERNNNQQLEKQIQELELEKNYFIKALKNANNKIHDLENTLENIPQEIKQKYLKQQNQNFRKEFELEL